VPLAENEVVRAGLGMVRSLLPSMSVLSTTIKDTQTMYEPSLERRVSELERTLRGERLSIAILVSVMILAFLARHRLPTLPGCREASFDRVIAYDKIMVGNEDHHRTTALSELGLTVVGFTGRTKIDEGSVVVQAGFPYGGFPKWADPTVRVRGKAVTSGSKAEFTSESEFTEEWPPMFNTKLELFADIGQAGLKIESSQEKPLVRLIGSADSPYGGNGPSLYMDGPNPNIMLFGVDRNRRISTGEGP